MRPKHGFLGFLLGLLLARGAGTQQAHEPLKPQRVQFQSRNFHNVLHWQPGKAPASDASIYFVQYKISRCCLNKIGDVTAQPSWFLPGNSENPMQKGTKVTTSFHKRIPVAMLSKCLSSMGYGQRRWKKKEDCWGVRALFCDLTTETSNAQEPYYARVRTASAGALSDWSMTQRFTPWWETKLDPPVINITQINGSLLVVLHAPDLPYKDQKGKNISMENYYELVYRVFIINNSLEKERKVYEGAHRVVEIKAPAARSGYCVTADVYRPMFDRSSHRSEERCVETA